MSIELKQGDALAVLKTMESESVQCAITSPPYWGLRDYGIDGQIGLEKTPEEYVSHIVAVMREVWRVLRDDGTLWLNLGDSYAGSWGNAGNRPELDGKTHNQREKNVEYLNRGGWDERRERPPSSYKLPGLKPKDLCMIPFRVAFALQADGWYLRSDIIWAKPNPMPESVTDRPTKAHEYVFLLAKSQHYYYDADAIREPVKEESLQRAKYIGASGTKWNQEQDTNSHTLGSGVKPRACLEHGPNNNSLGRNRRTVWNIATSPYSGAHFATFPPKLIEPMVLAGCPVGGTVLDMFCGTATVGAVCVQHNRNFIGIELNPKYIELARERIAKAQARDPRYLRECGMSLSEIAKTLKVTVPEVARQLK